MKLQSLATRYSYKLQNYGLPVTKVRLRRSHCKPFFKLRICAGDDSVNDGYLGEETTYSDINIIDKNLRIFVVHQCTIHRVKN